MKGPAVKPSINVALFDRSSNRKDDKSTATKEIDWDIVGQKAAIAQETAETVGKIVVVAYVAKKLVDTACEIAVIAAKAKL
jgi:hypothetical protein